MGHNSSVKGSNHQSTKLQNRSIVLKMICTGDKVTRIDISRQTGLSKMSVTNIVNELIEEGFVTDQAGELKNDSIGRNPISLEANTEIYRVLGLYLSRDRITATLSDLKCRILSEVSEDYAEVESENSFLEKIKKVIVNLISSPQAKNKKILGIGVSCIGPLDLEQGVILDPPNFHSIRSIAIVDFLQKEFGNPVYLNNDMNAAALAEKLYGKGKHLRDFVYVGVTNGIGSGIISNHSLFQGSMGFSGEFGHMSINFEGPRCPCGNTGCLELYASIPQILQQAKNALSLGMSSSLSTYENLQWINIVEEASRGDEFALNLLERSCLFISIGLVSLSNLYDPEAIFIGHEFSLAGSLVTQKIEDYMKDKVISRKLKSLPVKVSAFGEKAPLIGSSALVLNRLFLG